MPTTNENTIINKGPKLVENGYLVVPIVEGEKRPRGQGWQERRMTADDCEHYAANKNDGVGILCGVGDFPICALDFDIEGDESFAQAMESFTDDLVGESAKRVGKPPKFLVMYRASSPSWMKDYTPFYEKDGRRVRLEVLGKGQQFVAYHVHPDTGKPYEWPDEFFGLSPEDFGAEYLQVITQEQVSAIKAEFIRQAEERGYSLVEGSTGATVRMASADDLTPPKNPMPGVDASYARRVLKDLEIDLNDYDKWVKVGMALHHQFQGGAEGLSLWDELSREFPEKYDHEKLVEKYNRDFRDHGANITTFRSYVYEWEQRCNPDFSKTNELGLLHRFLFKYGDRIAYFPKRQVLCAYNEEKGHWTMESARAVVIDLFRPYVGQEAMKAIKERGEEDKWAKAVNATALKIGTHQAASENRVIQMTKDTLRLHRDRSDFDSNPRYFAVGNGVVDLETKELLPNAPELMVLRRSEVNYDTNAKCPTWEKAIYQCMGDDQEMVSFVKRLFGSALTGDPVEDKVAMLRGLGCNGKTVFTNTMRRVFGGYAEIVGEETIIGKSRAQGGQARSDIVALEGARLALCCETSETGRLNEADVKRMTGGDEISARAMYVATPTRFKTSFLLCLATNHMPEIKGDDDGIWRRVADIEFPRNFDTDPQVEKDPFIEKKIEKELPGVLNWLIEGLHEYKKLGLKIPKKVELNVQQYREDSNDVARWAEYRLIPDESGRESMQDCFNSFNQMMAAEKQKTDLTSQAFSRRLRKHMEKIGSFSAVYKTNGRTCLRGYRLASTEDLEDDPFS